MAPNGNGAARTVDAVTLTTRIGDATPNSRPANDIAFNMRSEVERLKTFNSWPVSFINKSSMAAAGFYYYNRDDVVRCAFCGLEMGCWEEGDNPLENHERWSPACPFLRVRSRNINKGSPPSSPTADIIPIRDVCGMYGVELRPNSCPERGCKDTKQLLLEQLGINKSHGPIYPMHASADARKKSFDSWPKCIKQRPAELSEAGFFYTGKGDETYCFHCGGGLKDWQPADDPWMEHAKWFPKCTYVVLVKGKEFVEKVSSKELLALSEDVKRIDTEVKEAEQPSAKESSDTKLSSSVEKASKPLDDSSLCKICFQEELGVVFLPCGHLVACAKCAPSLTTCAVCRKPFTATVRVFLS